MPNALEYVPQPNTYQQPPFTIQFFGTDHVEHFKEHWHDGVQILFNYSGTVKDVMISGKHYEVAAGKAIIINFGAMHEIDHVGGTETMVLILNQHFLREIIPELEVEQFIENPMAEDTPEAKKLEALLLELYEVAQVRNHYQLKTQRVIFDVLDLLLDEFTRPRVFSHTHFKSQYIEQQLVDILYYITQHLSEGVSPNDVAKAFHLTPSYLVRYFKKHLKRTPTEFILCQRLNRAERHLLVTDKNMQMISDIVGFGSIRSFERAFKQRYGMTPREFRMEEASTTIQKADDIQSN